jgi:membrane protein implicated in regulation of membrane protease activity
MGVSYLIVTRLFARAGISLTGTQLRGGQRLVLLGMVLGACVAGATALLLATGHPALGIGVLVAGNIVPLLVARAVRRRRERRVHSSIG